MAEDVMCCCPVCHSPSRPFRTVAHFPFFQCSACNLIHLSVETYARIDEGEPVRAYEEDYWTKEVSSATERTKSVGVARLCEAIYLCDVPVKTVIDIGTGTGLLLDTMAAQVPRKADAIHGVELFPPPGESRTTSGNYHIGKLGDLAPMRFEAGLCMEVVEHLTPSMMAGLLADVAKTTSDGACILFNTGLAPFVESEDPGYIDPLGRGHITFWTVEAVNVLARPHGLRALAMPGRTWSFLVVKGAEGRTMEERIHAPLQENLAFLGNGVAGESVLSLFARSGLNWFRCEGEIRKMATWALSLDKEVAELRARLQSA